MKIKNDSVRIQIGNKKYDFHNLILNEYIKRLINKQLSKESATNLTLTESTILTYLLLKLDTPINNLTQDSSITNYNFDIAIVHGASKHQNISEKQVVMQYDYNVLINDYVIDLNLVQQGKKSPETIKYLSDFYDRKITAIGFTTHWYPYKEVPVCAVLDTSNYSIFLERNQDLTISRKDIITTDAEFSTNNKEKVKGPAHLSPLGLPQIIYQPSIVQTLKDDEGNDYIKKHEFYDYAKGVLTSVGLSQNPNYIEKEYKIGEDIQAVNNETEIVINGIINDEKEEGNVYPSDELFPIEPRTLPIQSSKGIKETSIKTNEENDFFVNTDGRSTQDGTPTPNNPSEIKSIGDDINLFDKDTPSRIDKEVVWKATETGGIYSTSAGWKAIKWNFELDTNSYYTFSYGKRNSDKLYLYIRTYTDNTFTTVKTMIVSDGTNLINTFKPDSKYVSILFQGSVSINNIEIPDIKLQKGNQLTPYSKHGEGTLNIEQSSNNLFNASKITNTTISVLDSGKTIKMPIATSGNGYTQVGTNLKGVCPKLEVGDTVYLLGDTTSQNNKHIYLGGNSKFVWGFGKSKTLTENDLNAAFVLYGNNFEKGETEQVTISNLRIVKNASDEWEQYFNNTYTLPLSEPLRSLPNGVKDTLEADGIHRRVKKIILNGSENWVLYPNKIKTFRYQMSNLISTGLSNYYKRLSSATAFDVDTGIYLEYTNSIIISDPRFSTIDEFKTWLSTHNVEVIYNVRTATELVIETIEPYTDEQKEIISSMVTEKGTNIFNINENTGIEAVEYEGLYPETVNYKYVVFKYTVYQLVVTGVDSEGVEVQEIKDTGCYYYQAIPLEKFKKMKVKIKYERG